MVKSKKSVFIVLISLAAMLLTATLVLLFVPEPKPITITEKFYIAETQNGFELHGKIRNDSGEDRTFKYYGQQITVTLHINDLSGGTEYNKDYVIFNEDVTVKAGESYEINKELDIPCQAEITKVTAKLHKKEYSVNYTLYGNVINEGNFLIAAVFAGIAGGSLLIGASSATQFMHLGITATKSRNAPTRQNRRLALSAAQRCNWLRGLAYTEHIPADGAETL